MCSIVKSLIKHFEIRWLPEAAGCILVGLILGTIMEQVAPHIHYSFDGSLFLRVMLPFIVFHAALSIDKHALYLYLFPIALYAVVGTLVSSALVALFIYVGTGFGMPLVESCIFGALISSIDPIAVLSILQSLGMTTTDAIYVIIFGESLFNDGIAIVLYETLVEFLDETIVITSEEIIDSCIQFIVVILGSIGVGVLCGGFCTLYFYSMEGCQTPLVEVLIFLCWALIPYYICDGVSWSGIVGIVAAGIVMDLFVVGYHNTDQQQQPQENGTSFANNQITSPSLFHHHRRNISTASGNTTTTSTATSTTNINNTNTDLLCLCEVFRRIFTRKGHLSHTARNHVGFVAEINATLMETAIFAYLGLFLLSSRYKWNLYLTALAILSCLVSRAAMIPSMTFIANRISSSSKAAARSATATTSITSIIGKKLLSCLRNKKYTVVTLSPNSSIDDSFVDDDYPRNSSSSSSSSSQDRTAATTSPIIDQRMQIVLWFGGLRGAMSFALVENIPLHDASTGYGSRLKPELKAMTSASIIFTVFICGGTTFYLLEWLGMSEFSAQDAEMID
jgi:NhaP-type Na+/H+ or K+/H+ antiporter